MRKLKQANGKSITVDEKVCPVSGLMYYVERGTNKMIIPRETIRFATSL